MNKPPAGGPKPGVSLLDLCEQLIKGVKVRSLKMECLEELAKEYLRRGRRPDYRRIIIALDILDAKRKQDRDSVSRKQKYRNKLRKTPKEEARFHFRIQKGLVDTIGKEKTKVWIKELTKNPERVWLDLSSFACDEFRKKRFDYKFMAELLDLSKSWPGERNCIADEFVSYHFKRREWRQVIRYLSKMTDRDVQVWSLTLDLMHLSAEKQPEHFGMVMEYIGEK